MDCSGYEDVDVVFLGYPKHHERWHQIGVKTVLHLHCFDEAMLPTIQEKSQKIQPIDFSFIGTTGWGFIHHDGRYYDLKNIPIEV